MEDVVCMISLNFARSFEVNFGASVVKWRKISMSCLLLSSGKRMWNAANGHDIVHRRKTPRNHHNIEIIIFRCDTAIFTIQCIDHLT